MGPSHSFPQHSGASGPPFPVSPPTQQTPSGHAVPVLVPGNLEPSPTGTQLGCGMGTHPPSSVLSPSLVGTASSCPSVPGTWGHKDTAGAKPSLAWDSSWKEQHQAAGVQPSPRGLGGKGPPTCRPPLPLTSPTCSTLCSLPAKTPSGCPWGLLILPGDRKHGGSWVAASPPQPDAAPRDTPENTTGISTACRLPGGTGWQVPPKIPLWG